MISVFHGENKLHVIACCLPVMYSSQAIIGSTYVEFILFCNLCFKYVISIQCRYCAVTDKFSGKYLRQRININTDLVKRVEFQENLGEIYVWAKTMTAFSVLSRSIYIND